MAKSLASLIPGVEQRESGWRHLQERLQPPQRGLTHPSITLSREYGCEGYPLAVRLQALLEQATGHAWAIFDKALLDQVATDEGLSRTLLDQLGDASHAQDVLRAHFGYLTHDDAYAKVVKHMVQIASAGCAILVGRGGAVACQDLTNCLHFRLVGSLAFRAATLARRLELPLADAEQLARTQAQLREQFFSEYLHADTHDARWYDAVFNNERQDLEAIAQACLAMVLSRWPGKPAS